MAQFSVTVAGQTRAVSVEDLEDGRTRVIVDGQERVLDVRGGAGRLTWLDGVGVVAADVEGTKDGKLAVALRGQVLAAEVVDAAAWRLAEAAKRLPAGATGPTVVRSTMPGRIVKVLVKPGDDVKAGQGLVVVEAMKMENEIRAPRDGRVREVPVSEGAAVEASQTLVVLD